MKDKKIHAILPYQFLRFEIPIVCAVIGLLATQNFFGLIIGGLVGFFLRSYTAPENQETESNYSPQRNSTDFTYNMLVLIAAVMNADGYTLKSELELVKRLFLRTYGEEKSRVLLLELRELIKQNQDIAYVCRNLRFNMNYHQRVELLHVLFRISQADGSVNGQELNMLNYISNNLAINLADYLSIKAMFVFTPIADFDILGIDANASEEEVKKAYRQKAKEFHPDKLLGLSLAEKKVAEEKFIKVQEAYNKIKKQKGWI